jgi:hypothetical protein
MPESSSDAFATTCRSTDDPVSLDEVTRLVARLRAAGAKVINRRGEDLSPADIEKFFQERFRDG